MRFWKLNDFREWPPGISNGLASRCLQCGARPEFDFQIDDDAWQAIVPERMRAGVVCLPCLDTMAREIGIDVNQHMREVQFAGCQSTLVLVPSLVVETQPVQEPDP